MGARADRDEAAARAEEAERLLRAAGLRNTVARRAVIGELLRSGVPMSHGEMIAALTSVSLDRATVYRVLVNLEVAGVLIRTDLGDRLWRFELNRRDAHGRDHPHFVCTTCMSVTCLPHVSFSVAGARGAPQSLVNGAFAVRVAGICDACVVHPNVRATPPSTRPTPRKEFAK